MRSSADDCGCGSRNPATAPVTMPCCWPPQRRRVRAIAWSISAPASARPGLRSPAASTESSSSGRDRRGACRAGARQRRGQQHRGRCRGARRHPRRRPLRMPACRRQRRRRADESAVQRFARHRASPDKAREIAHVADPATLENWVHAARRILKSGGILTLIWRADGVARGAGGARPRLWRPGDPACPWRAAVPAIRVLVRAIKGGRAPTQILPSLMLNDESALPNKQVQEILAGKGRITAGVILKRARIAGLRAAAIAEAFPRACFGAEVK